MKFHIQRSPEDGEHCVARRMRVHFPISVQFSSFSSTPASRLTASRPASSAHSRALVAPKLKASTRSPKEITRQQTYQRAMTVFYFRSLFRNESANIFYFARCSLNFLLHSSERTRIASYSQFDFVHSGAAHCSALRLTLGNFARSELSANANFIGSLNIEAGRLQSQSNS